LSTSGEVTAVVDGGFAAVTTVGAVAAGVGVVVAGVVGVGVVVVAGVVVVGGGVVAVVVVGFGGDGFGFEIGRTTCRDATVR
jgi:hypothetical protein